MKAEELMVPRYEVISDYPYSPFEIGVVLRPVEGGELYLDVHGYTRSMAAVYDSEVYKYQNLFKSLKWWENRKIEDMPQYLKVAGNIHKVTWRLNGETPLYEIESVNTQFSAVFYNDIITPATEQEYKDYHSLTGTELAVKL